MHGNNEIHEHLCFRFKMISIYLMILSSIKHINVKNNFKKDDVFMRYV